MTILITGASGLIGSALVVFLEASGHEVVAASRESARMGTHPSVCWDPTTGEVRSDQPKRWDVVVHLAGENIAARWTAEKKRRIRDSRVGPTERFCEFLSRLKDKPGAFICASAIGYYGDRAGEILTEASTPGTGFLTDVCQEWEASTGAASRAGIRVVNVRFGVVLSAEGGALRGMLPIFRAGLGGKVGSGGQYWSWISLLDVVRAIDLAMSQEALTGPVNVVSPKPVTNREFTRTLGRVLHRPTVLSVPSFAAKAVFGEMAEALLLSSARVQPARLEATGFKFEHSDLESALDQLLDRPVQ